MTRRTIRLLPLFGLMLVAALVGKPARAVGLNPPWMTLVRAAVAAPPECSDGIDNDSANGTDWPADPSCSSPDDFTEDGVPACSDGIDNDLDGDVDYPGDSDCVSPSDPDEATLRQCQNRLNDDGNGYVDFATDPNRYALSDPGCHSPFDDQEYPIGFTPEVLPRVLVLVDTSGSMTFNTCSDQFTGGDGSEDFPGADVACTDLPSACDASTAHDLCDNGIADDSRIYQLKAGMTDVVGSLGEVEYALMRFRQRGVEFQFPTAVETSASGGWQGAVDGCEGFAGGDVVVGFSADNPPTLLEWIDGQNDYVGGNPPTSMVPPPGLDWELRATGLTPLAGALYDAYTYLGQVKADDPVEPLDPDCRPYRVVLITDGLESCGGDPVDAAAALYAEGFPVEVIAFAAPSAEVAAGLDAIAGAGSGYPPRPAMVVSDRSTLATALAQIVNGTLQHEFCNDLDDDCDRQTDEDFPDKGEICDNGRFGLCREVGVFVCDYPPHFPGGDGRSTRCLVAGLAPLPGQLVEECNGVDDDCDGKIDEELTCACCGQEVCNGIDDDWDGEIDEGHCRDGGAGEEACAPLNEGDCLAAGDCLWQPLPGVGQACGTALGLCELGALACVDADGDPETVDSVLDCVGGIEPATSDPCNGYDDDCDGFVDEDFGPPCFLLATDGCTWNAGLARFECLGLCSPGHQECVDPTPGEPENGDSYPGSCLEYVGPGTESCNGVDDDCDGFIDEDWHPDSSGSSKGEACSNGAFGVCEAWGSWVCDEADPAGPLVCTAPAVSPGIEACNGLDDDCDGLIDEGDCLDLGAGICAALDQTSCETTAGCRWQAMVPVGNPCGGGWGCDQGYLACVDADNDPLTVDATIECVGTSAGSPESCNGMDDDCDGLIDEPGPDGIAEIEKDCYPAGLQGCSGDAVVGFEESFVFNPACTGDCSPGQTVCALDDVLCIGYRGPAAFESCDGHDNDCDGIVDNAAQCPDPDDICQAGLCISPCDPTGLPCPFGLYCRTLADALCDEPPCRFCVEDPCKDVSCDPGFDCNSETGTCEDLCAALECPSGEICRGGFCFDCFDAACPAYDHCCQENERCVVGDNGVGACEPDLCYGVACADGEACVNGECQERSCRGEVCSGGGCHSTGDGPSGGAAASTMLLGLGSLLGRWRRCRRRHRTNPCHHATLAACSIRDNASVVGATRQFS